MLDENDIVNARRAGELLGLHEETMRRLARENKIPAFKVGGVWRFNKSSLYTWAESQGQRPRPRTRKTVLVVDDEEYIRDTVGQAVEAAGFRVMTASGGGEALEMIRHDPPDMVLLDLKMLDMDGATTLKEIRRIHGLLPVIIITGYPESELVDRTLDYCPVTLLAKPLDPEQLVSTVRMTLNGMVEHPTNATGE